jgi:hypothetical protein
MVGLVGGDTRPKYHGQVKDGAIFRKDYVDTAQSPALLCSGYAYKLGKIPPILINPTQNPDRVFGNNDDSI